MARFRVRAGRPGRRGVLGALIAGAVLVAIGFPVVPASAILGPDQGSPFDAPSRPTILSLTVVAPGSVSVEFQPLSGFTAFTATCSSSGNAPGRADGAGSPIVVTGLMQGATYNCLVAGPGVAGSAMVSVALPAVPSAPTGPVDLTPSDVGAVSVSFPDAPEDGVTFTATCTSDDGDTATASGTGSPLAVAGLTVGVEYVCGLTRSTALGGTSTATTSAPITLTEGLPAAPTGVSASAFGNAIRVAFDPAPTGDAFPVTSWLVSCSSSDGGVSQSATGTASPIRVASLSLSRTYTCVVRAVNELGSGPGTTTNEIRTVVPPPPSPTSVTAVRSGLAGISVSFAPADGVVLDGPFVTRPTFNATCVSSTGGATRSAAGSGSPILVTSLSTSNAYRCSVTMSTLLGTSDPSPSSEPVILPVVPGAPLDVVAAATPGFDSRLTVSFTEQRGDTAVGIDSSRAVCTSAGGVTRSASNTVSPIVVSGLSLGATYTCRVTSTNIAGAGPASVPSAPVTLPSLPGAPTGVSAVVTGVDGLRVSFTPPAITGSSPVTSYRVACASLDGQATRTATVAVTAGATEQTTLRGFVVGTRYECTVWASNAAGRGPASLPSAVVTVLGAPGAPTAVTPTPTTPGRFSVAFTPPANLGAVGTPPAVTYRVVCTSADGRHSRSAQGTASPVVITLLVPGQSYTCRASATNAAGTGAASAPSASVVAPGAIPI